MLLRLAYLGMVNAFAMLRLLPMSDREKDAEILALRHQITVLERQLGERRVRFTLSDRAFLAALLHRLPRDVLRKVRLPVRPDTLLRWHRDLLARRHGAASRPKRPGRPRTVHSIRALVLRRANENPSWGYRRVHGELLVLGVKVAASTVWEILKEAGIDPARQRSPSTWADFLCSQADALLACDFFETATLSGARLYVFAVIEHTNQPTDPDPGRHRAPDRLLGGASREESRHGPRGLRLPGPVPDPGQGWQVPSPVRRDPQGRGDRGRAQRCPDAEDELDHGKLGADLPTRTPGPHLDLEPAPSAACPARVRAFLQLPPPTSGHREHAAATPLAHTNCQSGRDSPTYADANGSAAS